MYQAPNLDILRGDLSRTGDILRKASDETGGDRFLLPKLDETMRAHQRAWDFNEMACDEDPDAKMEVAGAVAQKEADLERTRIRLKSLRTSEEIMRRESKAKKPRDTKVRSHAALKSEELPQIELNLPHVAPSIQEAITTELKRVFKPFESSRLIRGVTLNWAPNPDDYLSPEFKGEDVTHNSGSSHTPAEHEPRDSVSQGKETPLDVKTQKLLDKLKNGIRYHGRFDKTKTAVLKMGSLDLNEQLVVRVVRENPTLTEPDLIRKIVASMKMGRILLGKYLI